MDIHIGNPSSAYLLVIVAALMAVRIAGRVARRRATARFAGATFRPRRIPTATTSMFWLRTLLVGLGLTLLVIALMDIRWDKTWQEVPQKGIEVVFALDVSRSMLAEDATPNRLSRAKQQIKDMIDVMAGNRVGLVVFAGEARVSIPLTSHYDEFKQTLDEVGPDSVRLGGSRLGEALTTAAECFLDKTNDHKTIVIFTDGEDQESKPVETAKSLYDEKQIRVFAIGLGDMDQGARVPNMSSRSQQQSYIEYHGSLVWSKMNGEVLQAIASATGGAYVPAGTKRVNMADVYRDYVANVETTQFEMAKINAYVPRFQWFAVPALVVLVMEVLLSTAMPSVSRISTVPSRRKGGRSLLASLFSGRSPTP